MDIKRIVDKGNQSKSFRTLEIAAVTLAVVLVGAFFYFHPSTPVGGQSVAADVKVGSPATYTEPMTITSDTKSTFSIAPLGANAAQAATTGAVTKYVDAFTNTDITETKQSDRIKEDIILKKPGHPATFAYQIDVAPYDVVKDGQGSLVFYLKGHSGDTVYWRFSIPEPVMIDATGKKSTVKDIESTLTTSGILTVIPSAAWLAKAAYPVDLDPTIIFIFRAGIIQTQSTTINYLVIAGGGGGGGHTVGGGGGAGGMLTGTATVTSGTGYSIVVGGGGAGNANATGSNGVNSSALGITSTGGGGGGGEGVNGVAGGSGGGGGDAASGGAGTSGQGYGGGNGGTGSTYPSGGGGGAGAVGVNGNPYGNSGAGGVGVSNSISGSAVYYCGGGGGAASSGIAGAGAGGSSIGGAGKPQNSGSPGNGTMNTGSGGGGSNYTGTGGSGGSGIVIISATIGVFSPTLTTGGTHTQSGGNDIWTFTGSGTWTPAISSAPITPTIFRASATTPTIFRIPISVSAPTYYPTLKTNQTICYDNTGGTATVVSCTGTGEDGELQKGVARSYTDNSDGTITDNSTGLVWQKCSDGLSGSTCTTGTAATATWTNALAYCNANTAGLPGSGWRLPNVYELYSILDFGGASAPYINATYFPATQSSGNYWLSTTYSSSKSNALNVNFNTGSTASGGKASSLYVRCVRG